MDLLLVLSSYVITLYSIYWRTSSIVQLEFLFDVNAEVYTLKINSFAALSVDQTEDIYNETCAGFSHATFEQKIVDTSFVKRSRQEVAILKLFVFIRLSYNSFFTECAPNFLHKVSFIINMCCIYIFNIGSQDIHSKI